MAKSRRGPGVAPGGKGVAMSIRVTREQHARISAAASLAGLSKSEWAGRALDAALAGLIVVQRRGAGREGHAGDAAPGVPVG